MAVGREEGEGLDVEGLCGGGGGLETADYSAYQCWGGSFVGGPENGAREGGGGGGGVDGGVEGVGVGYAEEEGVDAF